MISEGTFLCFARNIVAKPMQREAQKLAPARLKVGLCVSNERIKYPIPAMRIIPIKAFWGGLQGYANPKAATIAKIVLIKICDSDVVLKKSV